MSTDKEKAQQTVEFAGLSVGGRCRVRTCDPCRVKASERQKHASLSHEAQAPDRQKSPRNARKLHRNYTGFVLALLLTACGGGGSSTPPPEPAPTASPTAPAPSAPSVSVHIVAFGDSTQAAQGNPHAASRPGWTIENKGISGSSTTQWVAKWSDELAATKAPIVIYNGGLNDGGLTLEEYKHALRELVRITRAYKKQIILEQPNNADASGDIILPTFIERRAAVEGVAKSEGVYYCAQPDVPLRDGIHPTDAGYAAKAERLAECLKDAI